MIIYKHSSEPFGNGGVIRRGEYGYFLRFQITQRFDNLIIPCNPNSWSKEQQVIHDLIKSLHNGGMGYRKIAQYLNEKGIKTEEVDSKTKGVIKESAERNVKLALIFAEISKVENILVDDNEIEQVIASIAKSQNTQISKVKKYYKDNNLMDDVKVKLTDEKVIRFLVSEANIKEIKPKTVK